MAQTLKPATESRFLPRGEALETEIGGYHYKIRNDGDDVTYEVNGPGGRFETVLDWVFGTGHSGQTFVFERGGELFESRVSYYPRIDGLDLTIGAANAEPGSLLEGAGRKMSGSDVRECFGCHSTSGSSNADFSFGRMTPGVRCARCHEGAAEHAESIRAGELVRPKKVWRESSEHVLEFCGSCHRTWADVMLMGVKGVNNVRFQPYRLSLSRCYDPTDSRLNCIQCHDPHRAVVSDVKSYDHVCQSCHQAGGEVQCSTGAEGCADCHMPKTELPGANFAFRDHNIRVVREGEGYPE